MKRKPGIYETHLKRLLDLILSVTALLLLSPVLLVTALLVRVNLGSPVLFCQPRPGKDGKVFMLYKFRSMTNREVNGVPLPDEQRLPPFGKMLRKTSLDELPELFNILWGDMSLVGPRPLLVKYLPLYNEEQKKRHNVRPGLTGWAQVNGRNAITWEERFALDVWYVDHISFFTDLKILLMTAKKVFVCEGITSDTSATMEEFRGTENGGEG